MKRNVLLSLPFFLLVFAAGKKQSAQPWQGKMQTIPGKIQAEFYDEGGEGVAYHDTDSTNNGSGRLNPANGNFYNEFRKNEGVDISYTKTGGIDDNPYNKVEPDLKSLYVGWTQPGEWINYTVAVKETGVYKVSVKYTSNGNGTIAFDVDGKPVAASLNIPTTHNPGDTIAWRQWHHWSMEDPLCQMHLVKGTHQLRLHVTGNGNMNFDYFEFIREKN